MDQRKSSDFIHYPLEIKSTRFMYILLNTVDDLPGVSSKITFTGLDQDDYSAVGISIEMSGGPLF